MTNQQSPMRNEDASTGLSPVLERNIEALVRRRERDNRTAGGQQKVADAITAFTGSMRFVYLHLLVFGLWIAVNLHWIPAIRAFDESFVVLAMVASVEAIFLSTFVLISQNRMAAEAAKRADLDLQISLLTEHELTKMAALLGEVAERLHLDRQTGKDFEEVTRPIAPEAVLDQIEKAKSDK